MSKAEWDALSVEASALSAEAGELTHQIRPLLAGKSPEVQGAVLGELTATWIAGFRSEDPKDQQALRRNMLAMQFQYVWELVEAEDADRN